MNIVDLIKKEFISTLTTLYQDVDQRNITFALNTDASKQAFGDISSNAAMMLSNNLKQSPRVIGQNIIEHFSHGYVKSMQLAGPGFINISLTNDAYILLFEQLVQQQQLFFKPTIEKVHNFSVEFVSANPTGPLHVGHGRGGIIGDVLANILRFIGHKATKEFYINDAGNQIQKLGECFKIRCLQQVGQDIQIPEDGYQGEYLVELAQQAHATYGDALLKKDNAFFAEYAKKHLLENVKKTLSDYGIKFDVWFSEKTLHEDHSITKALEKLSHEGYTYEQDGALWFKSTAFGDDKDRVLRKSTGELTYVAADVAYMINKFNRGFDHLIMVLGQDHHSYVSRLEGLLKATGFDDKPLDVILYQLVSIKQSGQALRLSKRAGRIVSLEEVTQLVGTDVARFFFLNRKADSHLDFDIDLALKKTEENPVYYIQYAYVRIRSILAKTQEHPELSNISIKDAAQIDEEEYMLLKKILSLRDILHAIEQNHQTHLLTYYVLELAQAFHSYYSKNRVIDLENPAKSRARLLLLAQLQQTFEVVLTLLELSTPEQM